MDIRHPSLREALATKQSRASSPIRRADGLDCFGSLAMTGLGIVQREKRGASMSGQPLAAQNFGFRRRRRPGSSWTMPIAAFFGFSITRLEPGLLEVTQPYRPELCFQGRMFQAGPIGTLADFAGAGACFSMLPPGWLAAISADYAREARWRPRRGRYAGRAAASFNTGCTLVGRGCSEVPAVTGGQEILCATALVTARQLLAAR